MVVLGVPTLVPSLLKVMTVLFDYHISYIFVLLIKVMVLLLLFVVSIIRSALKQ